MAELLNNSFQELTPEMLKTQDGVNILNNIIKQLVDNVPSDLEKVRVFRGYGTPESSVSAGIGSLYMRVDGGTSSSVYVKESGTGNTGWVAIGASAGSGDVVGPSSSTDNAITRYDGTTGKLIQNSNIKLTDSDIIDIPLTTAGSAGGILLESTSAFGSANPAFIQHKGSADARVNIYNNLNVQDQVVFNESGTTNPAMLLGNTTAGYYGIAGQYSATPASLRMITGYIWEFTKYLFCTAMSVGASNVSGLNAAPTNGMLVEGHVKEQASYRSLDQDFSKTTNTTLGNVTGASSTSDLLVALTAGMWYTFQAKLFVDSDAVGGHKYAIGGTATATSIIYNINSLDNATNAYVITSRQTALAGSAGQVGSTASYTEINGTIKCNAAGTFTVQFAQNVSNGTSTVLKGSTFVVKEVHV